MRSTITLFLLPVFLFSIIGWQWMFVLQLNKHQASEWSTVFEDEDLDVIILKSGEKNQDTFFINGHELFHQGKFYDVKYKKRRGDEIVYYCHSDNEEGKLFSSLNIKLKDEQGLSNSSKQKSQKVVKLSVFDDDQSNLIFDTGEIHFLNFFYTTPSLSITDDNPVFVPPDVPVLIS